MNHLKGLNIKVVSEWPTLPKNFNRKENTMQYMTNKMLQRFISELAKDLNSVNRQMGVWRKYAVAEAIELGKSEDSTRKFRDYLADTYAQYSQLQKDVKSNNLTHSTLQKMEKCVTWWIVDAEGNKQSAYEHYLDNRYDPFYRNKSKQAKKKLAKLVELQQAIRKQKSITKD